MASKHGNIIVKQEIGAFVTHWKITIGTESAVSYICQSLRIGCSHLRCPGPLHLVYKINNLLWRQIESFKSSGIIKQYSFINFIYELHCCKFFLWLLFSILRCPVLKVRNTLQVRVILGDWWLSCRTPRSLWRFVIRWEPSLSRLVFR